MVKVNLVHVTAVAEHLENHAHAYVYAADCVAKKIDHASIMIIVILSLAWTVQVWYLMKIA